MDGDYGRYLRAEWQRFLDDPAEAVASRAVVPAAGVRHVLDVGCGAGQELLPFVAGGGSLGVGVDVHPDAGGVGRELFAHAAPGARVRFARAAAEALPFASGAFDLIICRVALPYMHNRRALDEMARVLREDGTLVLKIHHARFYVAEGLRAIASRSVRPLVHVLRVLAAGTLYHVLGWQPRNRLLGGEVFQSRWQLRREIARRGLRVVAEIPGSDPGTPSFVIRAATR